MRVIFHICQVWLTSLPSTLEATIPTNTLWFPMKFLTSLFYMMRFCSMYTICHHGHMTLKFILPFFFVTTLSLIINFESTIIWLWKNHSRAIYRLGIKRNNSSTFFYSNHWEHVIQRRQRLFPRTCTRTSSNSTLSPLRNSKILSLATNFCNIVASSLHFILKFW